MQKETKNRLSRGWVAGISAIVVAVGAGTAWLTVNHRTANPPTNSDTTPSPVQNQTPTAQKNTPQPKSPATQIQVKAFYLQDRGSGFDLVPTPVQVAQTATPKEALQQAFSQLLASQSSSSQQSFFSTIPEATQLRSVSVAEDGIHVDLSEEFVRGGGSAAMMGRLGQVVYTATSFDPQAQVWISVNGEPLKLLGGEGLEIPQPITREQFNREFSL
jgi:spore germination protein GerM